MTVTENGTNVAKERASGKKIAKIVFSVVLLLLANYVFMFMIWILRRYDDVQFDQILYQIKSPIAGTSGGLIGSALGMTLGIGSLIAGVEFLIYFLLAGKITGLGTKIKKYAAYAATRVAGFFKKRHLALSSSALVLSMLIFIFRLGVHAFIYNAIVDSDFIETHYVDPDKTELVFPEEKRNLIYIFLESMETTYQDPSVGGKITEDFIPELTQLANENVSFTGAGGKGGALSYVGTRWTAAALFAQTSGVVIKVPLNFDIYGSDGTYMPGIATLGDVLEKEGYQQTILLGSDAGFAARDAYFTEHGNYKIIDVYSLIEEGKLPEGYWEWWGFEDHKLFDFAKEELLRLAATGQPFNFTTLTADTHFPDGYVCDRCPDVHEEQYANVLSCSSTQVYEFIEWCKQQSFYENTTIVLAGDHLTMDPNFLEGIDENYVRTTYNCIINSAVEPVKESDRQFATFDMFPTTLAAMGVTIPGNRLGLGVNLFSDVATLTEQYGYERIERELQKSSAFYIEQFYEDKKENE